MAELNGINTHDQAAAIRAKIFSTILRTQLEPDLQAMKYVDMINDFPDGDKWQDTEIGNAVVHDYVEGSDITYDGLDIGTRDFEINEYIHSGHYITEKFTQDSYLSTQITAKIGPLEARAIMADLETKIFNLPNKIQTAGNTNSVDGYRHRFVAGYVDGVNDKVGTVTPVDFSYGAAALDYLGYTGPKVAILPPHQQHLIGTFGDLAKLSDNPRWEGIVREGAVSGMHFAFSIYGVDVYVSNFLPKITNETLEMSTGATKKKATQGTLGIMFANMPERRPFRMAWRMMPKFEGKWNMDKRREEYVTVARYGLGAGDSKNLISFICTGTPEDTFTNA